LASNPFVFPSIPFRVAFTDNESTSRSGEECPESLVKVLPEEKECDMIEDGYEDWSSEVSPEKALLVVDKFLVDEEDE
jgi:hypothetical protein